MPVYKVKTPAGETLVKAVNKSAAINHVIRNMVTAENMTADDVAEAASLGLKIEIASGQEKPDLFSRETKVETGE